MMKVKWVEHIARVGKVRIAYNILAEKFYLKRLFGRSKRKWKDRITIGSQEMCMKAWTGFIWLRIRTTGGLL
jgi:hypothetical protein